ncbi:MAG: DUF2306 domain-containing protein [Alphaproteobacteria bacterium]|nr:MAG: DUF2306 domain-containing protein [Alphaproteobacteria bacterium]
MTFFSYLHIASAIMSYLTAFLLFLSPVGARRHRMLGIAYAVSMLSTALSGFGMYNTGGFSVFHIFSVVTVVTIARGWWAIFAFRRTRDRTYLIHHYFNMAYSFMGLNLAAIAQATRLMDIKSWSDYLATVGVFYLFAVSLSVYLVRKVFYPRFANWFGHKQKAAE